MIKIYVLTKGYNLYNQQGDYFISVFDHLPNFEELTSLGVPVNRVSHVQNGGGRKDYEESWFNLVCKSFKGKI